jgi:hypothetical protein
MTVFVTDAKPSSPGQSVLRWARLYSDDATDRDLAVMAADLRIPAGMRFARTRDHAPYYVITPEQRTAALAAGAKASRSMPAMPEPAPEGDDLFSDVEEFSR